jgi:GTP pyrophosphokinase
MNVPDLEELYAGIGYGGVALSRVIAKVKDEAARQKAAEAKEAKMQAYIQKPRKSVANTGVIVEGLDNCLVKFSKCCTPVPGDPIIGFITRGFGVSVHRQDCANAKASARNPGEEGRWIRTEWADEEEKHIYQTGIRITAANRVGLLSDVVNQLSNMKINVSELNAREDEDGNGVLYMTISVHDKGQLEFVINRLMRVSGVSEVKRIVAGG